VAATKQMLDQAESAVAEEDERQQAQRAAARQNAQRLQTCRHALGEHEQQVSALRQRHDRLQQEVAWRRSLEQQATRSLADIEDDLAQLEGELAAIESSLADANARVEALRAELQSDSLQELRRQAAECETALAVSMRTRQTQEQFATAQREVLARAEVEAQARQAQLEHLQQESAEVEATLSDLRTAFGAAEQLQESMSGPQAQLEADLQSTEAEQEALARQEEQARHELQAQLAELNRLTLARERVRNDVSEVTRQMESELGPVELPDIAQPRQLHLSLGAGLTPLPRVTELPDGLATRLKELRSHLKRLGAVNPAAPAEYDEVLQRHRFLTDQVRDLSEAADSARGIITELNRVIRDRFSDTFRQVARQFSTSFSTLFNGGSARLLLTDPDNPAESGIDIVVQPPGKRSQNLSMLSGGERALTAASLLFALLRVNPLPFCVLDEVDAMLDEANVHRFRALLEELAFTTQFIVITHNRATVDAASTVYGISMAREGTSQVLSLALPNAASQDEPEEMPAAQSSGRAR
jgi:chromosome segregation protein